jgi:low molecular weight protein-tyrosine phosphatase
MRILLVCLGNICRSPVAEAALRRALEAAGRDDVEVDSAGTDVWYPGESPDERMSAAARELGLDVRGAARQVTAEDFATADLLLAMDRRNLAALERLAPDDAARARVRLFGDAEVPDPFVGEASFPDVAAAAVEAANALVASLMRPC